MRDLAGGQKSLWGSILAISVAAPLWEEALFRGVILRGFLQRYGVRTAIVVSAMLFAVYHLNPWQFAGAATAGLLLAWCYVRTGSLVPCVLGHAVNNSIGFVMMAMPFKIPGYSASVTDAVQHQPLWFDLAGVIVAVMGLVWLRRSFSPTGRASSEVVSSSQAEPTA
jgi:hypothetical protein